MIMKRDEIPPVWLQTLVSIKTAAVVLGKTVAQLRAVMAMEDYFPADESLVQLGNVLRMVETHTAQSASTPEVTMQPVYRSGFLWGFLRCEFHERENEMRVTAAHSVIAGEPLPEWVVPLFFGEDIPSGVDQYIWDSVSFN
jgi:hypothetical protein